MKSARLDDRRAHNTHGRTPHPLLPFMWIYNIPSLDYSRTQPGHCLVRYSHCIGPVARMPCLMSLLLELAEAAHDSAVMNPISNRTVVCVLHVKFWIQF